MPDAPLKTPREAWGNGCVLLLADSTQAEYAELPESMFAALTHFGIPYRVHDLGRKRLSQADLSDLAGIIVGQEHIGLRLTAPEVEVLIGALRSGLGLVNFDHDIGAYGGILLEALGLTSTNSSSQPNFIGVEELVIKDDDHFVSYTQGSGARHRFKMPLPASFVRAHAPGPQVLAESAQGVPLLVVARLDYGRAVQWLVSPKLWLRQYFGHARGLDDLFWKSIVWIARKPFVMKAMLPFVRLRFDDCNGLWRDAADLQFVDVLNAFGHKPSLCVCIRAITADGARKIRELYTGGRAEFAPHTLKPGTGIFYGDERGEYSSDEFHAIMQEVDDHLQQWGVRHSKILSDHDHEYSSKVLPLLKERGISFKMNITLPDERWTDIHVDWRPAPYGSMSYALDYLPSTHDLFAVFNHYPTFDYARSYLPDGRFLYNRTGGYGDHVWDFLNGLTIYRGQRRTNDIETAAQRLAAHTRLGLDSLFFGGSITHSHFAQGLSSQEWRSLLERYEVLTARYKKLNVGYDSLAEYAKAKVDTHLVRVELNVNEGSVRCTLVGEASIPLQLYVFRDTDNTVESEFETVPEFRGRTEVKFGIG